MITAMDTTHAGAVDDVVARRGGTRAQILSFALVLWTLAAMLAMVAAAPQDWMAPTDWSAWLSLLVLIPSFAAAETFVVHLRMRADAHTFSLVELPLAFGLAFAPPFALLAAQLIGAGLALSVHRRQNGIKLLFNLGVFALTSVAAIVLFRHLAPVHGDFDSPALLALAAALMLEALLSVLLVFLVISLSTGSWRVSDLSSGLGFGFVATLFTTSLAVIGVVVVDLRPGVGWMLIVPIVGTYLANWAYTNERRRHEGLDFLYRSTQLLRQSAELEPAVIQLLRHTCETFNAEAAEVLYLADSADDGIRLRVGLHAEPELDRGVDEADQCVMRLVADGHARVAAAEDPVAAEYLELRGYRSAIVAPLVVDARVAGALVIANRRSEVMTFDITDVRLAETLASHTVTAVENGRLEQSLQQLRVLETKLTFQAHHDPLTGLANRTLFRSNLEAVMAEYDHTRGAVLFVDLDDFKTVNDSFGHATGDDLLVEVAARLLTEMTADDTIARLGGDEFAVLLSAVSEPDQAASRAAGMLAQLDSPIEVAHRRIAIRASIGVAMITPGSTPETVMRSADTAMYTAKAQGKHRVVEFEPAMYESSLHRFNLHSDLQRALRSNELVVHYQPIIAVEDRRLVAVEALVRWRHPQFGWLLPDSFIPLAEQTGLLTAIDRFVLGASCQLLAGIDERDPQLIPRVNVNLSPRSVQDPLLLDLVQATLEATGLAADRLGVEITENLMSEEADRAIEGLHGLRAMGVHVSLDDFGTGYSSLSYLQSLPVEVVKIAKPFVDDLETSQSQRAFIAAIVALGQALDMFVVAEGVERPEQLELLQGLGCDAVQGHYFARAMDASALVAWARRWSDRDVAALTPA